MKTLVIREHTQQTLSREFEDYKKEVLLLRSENAQLVKQIIDYESWGNSIREMECSLIEKEEEIVEVRAELMASIKNYKKLGIEMILLEDRYEQCSVCYNTLLKRLDRAVGYINSNLQGLKSATARRMLTKIKQLLKGNIKNQ